MIPKPAKCKKRLDSENRPGVINTEAE